MRLAMMTYITLPFNEGTVNCEIGLCVCSNIRVCLCELLYIPFHSELSTIREHDAFASQQADHAHRQLAVALEQTRTNSECSL